MKSKKSFIFLLILATCMFGIGLTLIIIGALTNAPDMSAPNWFIITRQKSAKIFSGIFITIFASMMLLVAIARKKMSSNHSTEVDELDEQDNQIDTQEKTCEYCGTILNNTKKCESCGAVIKKKKK